MLGFGPLASLPLADDGAGVGAQALHGKFKLDTWNKRGRRVVYPDEIDAVCVPPFCEPEPEPEPKIEPVDPRLVVPVAVEAGQEAMTEFMSAAKRARDKREAAIAAHKARLAQDDEYLLLTA